MTDDFGLCQKDISTLRQILAPLSSRFHLAVFGSRAKDRWRTFSDLDILVSGPEPIPLQLLAAVESDLAESNLSISVDLVDAKRASPDFVNQIAPSLVEPDWLT